MHGKNFKWVGSIEALLKSHMKATPNMSSMHRLISHHMLVHKLHTIVHHAAAHNHKMIKKMYHALGKKGFVSHHFSHINSAHHQMMRASSHILNSVHHIFGHHLTHTRVVS